MAIEKFYKFLDYFDGKRESLKKYMELLVIKENASPIAITDKKIPTSS